jgi:hypothetical protein
MSEKTLILCGLSVPPDMPAMYLNGAEIRWTSSALRSFEVLRGIGEKLEKLELPYRSLSWLVEMGCPGLLVADSSAGLNRKQMAASMKRLDAGKDCEPVMWIDLDESLPGVDQVARLRQLVRDWLDSDAFRAYFAPLDHDDDDEKLQVDVRRRMIREVEEGKVLEIRPFSGRIAPWSKALTAEVPAPYELLRARFQHLLSGRELFPGAGPCRRVVTPRNTDFAELVTDPMSFGNMLDFSLKARLSIVTVPGVDHPILKVEASRARWTREIPDVPRRNSNADGLAFPADRTDIAYRFKIARQRVVQEVNGERKANWTWVPNTDFHEMRRHLGQAPIGEAQDILSRRADDRKCSYRIAHHSSYGNGGDEMVKSGVPETDRVALMECVAEMLAEHGLKPFSAVKSLSATTKKAKSEDVRDFIHPHGLGWMLEALDQIDGDDQVVDPAELAAMSEDDIRATMQRHMDRAWAEATKLSLPTGNEKREAAAKGAANALDAARAAMAALYGDTKPLLTIFHHQSKDALDSAKVAGVWAKVMTGDAVEIQLVPLPDGVHGPRPVDPGTKRPMKRDRRAENWEAAWRSSGWPEKLARAAATRPVLCLMVVPKFMATGRTTGDGKPQVVQDDPIAKLITRKVLASTGRATVQYLLPAPAGKPISLNERMHQVQSALRDLIWAHAGRVDGLPQVVGRIVDPGRQPKSLVGIFVLASQSKLLFTKHGFFLPLATKLDVATRRCFLSWIQANGTMAPWTDFREGLFRIAALDGMSAEERGSARAAFQRFVRGVVDSVRTDNPLVMIDATHTRNLWTWLTNPRIGQAPLTMDGQDHVTHGWDGVRILRVDGELGMRVISKKPVRVDLPDGSSFDYSYGTSDKEFLAINPGGPAPVFYSVVRHLGYGQPKRGQSCYRPMVMDGERVIVDDKDPAGLVTKIEEVEKPLGGQTKRMCRGLFEYPPMADKNASLPVSVEITVGLHGKEDDPVTIARMAHNLRDAMAHYIDGVKLPPPLYLKRIVKDYAIGLELKGSTDDDDQDET